MNAPAVLGVVVPARDEAELLPRCLAALDGAAQRFRVAHPHVVLRRTVVLDTTTDDSARVLRAHPHWEVLDCDAGRVGAARDLGIRHLLTPPVDPRTVWITNTDADSMVPPDWLCRQYAFAVQGWDLVVGTVEPVEGDLTAAQRSRWATLHNLSEGHGHIHGANLGFRADTYLALGGYPHHAVHEDRDLVRRAREAGCSILATDTCRVRTSGRLRGRVTGGFADHLTRLGGTP